jgi:hypothetical protein
MRLSMWVASSDRIRTGLGYEQPVEIEEGDTTNDRLGAAKPAQHRQSSTV